MIRLLFPPTLGSVRSLSLVAAATLMLSIAASERTEAMSPINPGLSRAAQDNASALFSQVFLTAKGDDLPPIDALGMFFDSFDNARALDARTMNCAARTLAP